MPIAPARSASSVQRSMSSSSRALGCAVLMLAAGAHASPPQTQPQAQGFGVERFYPSAPEGGWFVMDALDMRGGLGGAMSLNIGYASNPLRITDGLNHNHLSVVTDQPSADFGFAVTYHRWRWD